MGNKITRIEIVRVNRRDLPEGVKKGIIGKIFVASVVLGKQRTVFEVTIEEAKRRLDPDIVEYLNEENLGPRELKGLSFSEDEVKVVT
ncbi:MAG: hypothetical protein PHC97_02375 [Patescibacteria group bacterium]|nr:hypothetical protein [Patescibacteria group bacterium]